MLVNNFMFFLIGMITIIGIMTIGGFIFDGIERLQRASKKKKNIINYIIKNQRSA